MGDGLARAGGVVQQLPERIPPGKPGSGAQPAAMTRAWRTLRTGDIVLFTGLFPSRPSAEDVALLHHYGIDCLFNTTGVQFERLPAPAARRSATLALARSE